jgi:hypothetical protein
VILRIVVRAVGLSAPAGVALSRLGQAHREFAASSRSGTRRGHATAVHLNDHADQSEADADARRPGARSCLVCLYEQIKDVRQHIVSDAYPRIPDANAGVSVACGHRQVKFLSSVSVIGNALRLRVTKI